MTFPTDEFGGRISARRGGARSKEMGRVSQHACEPKVRVLANARPGTAGLGLSKSGELAPGTA